MARTVLLIEPDVDVLGALASKLRTRGLEVWIADGLESALVRVRTARPDVVLLSAELPDDTERAFTEAVAMPNLPCFRLVDEADAERPETLPRRDADAIARRVHALPTASPSIVPEASDFRGDLAQVSVVDLIQLLAANRRSGVLLLQTPLGAGEVRFGDGEVIDALYRRLEGRKAFYRLLGERDGSFSFVGAAPGSFMRRIDVPTHALLMDGIRELDEGRELRNALDLGDDALVAVQQDAQSGNDARAMVLALLTTPRTLPELLDDVPALDMEVLSAVTKLLSTGAIRRISGGTGRVELSDPDRLGVLAALAKRVARAGFRDAGRLAIAAAPSRLLGLGASIARIAEAMTPSEAVPTTPIPHVLATLRLAESVDLDIVGIPLVEAYAPLWSLVLPGCSAIAVLDDERNELLESACQLASVPMLDPAEAPRSEDDARPETMALLIERLLESAAGA
jgi:CheY-like chemotaxis protein